MNHTVYLGLGSNVGGRIEFLAAAVRGIAQFERTAVEAVSNVYETEPVGNVPQKDFLNLALSVRTGLPYDEFHARTKKLEKTIGRRVTERWGPREIDIDLLMYDALIVATEEITIPHAEMAKRKFVLLPLADIAKDAVHPVLRRTIGTLCAELSDHHGVVFSPEYTTQLSVSINDSITNPTV